MSGDQRIEALERIYAAWGTGDFSIEPEIYSHDWVWGFSDEFVESGPVAGSQAQSDHLRNWLSQWTRWRCEAERYLPAGDRVLVLAKYTGSGRQSEVEVEHLGAHIWTFRGDEATKLVVYADRQQALRDAALTQEET